MASLRTFLLTLMIGASLATPAAAQWKWKGKDGRVQYSDLPPPAGVAEEDILQKPNVRRSTIASTSPASAAASSALTPKGVEPALEAQRKKADQEVAAKKKAEEDKATAAKAENCTRARTHLRALDEGLRIARTNAKGEREVLDDKQRVEETRRTREVIASDCK